MICPICKREMKKGSSVCEFCGYRQVRYCKTCGRMLKSGQEFCPTCEAEKLEAQQEEDLLMADLDNSLQKNLEAELAKMMPEVEEPEAISLAEPEEELPETIEEIPMMEESEAEEPAEEAEVEEIPELPEDPAEDLSLEELYQRAIAGKLLDDEEEEERFEEASEEEIFEETPEETSEETLEEISEETSEEAAIEEVREEPEKKEAPEEEPEELPVLVFPEELFAEEEIPAEVSAEEEKPELYSEESDEELSEEEESENEKPVRPIGKKKEEKKKKSPILLWLLILLVLIVGGVAAFSHFGADDHPEESPYYPEKSTPEETLPPETTPEETTPEEITPEETTPEETTEPETTVPPTDPYEPCVLKGVLTYNNRKYGIRITEGTPFTFVDDRKNVLGVTDITFAGEEEYYGYINQKVTVTGDIAMVDGVPYLYVSDFACKQDQNFVYSERVIHRYELVRADVTYEQAAADAAARGGYLARITTEDEFNHITAQISAQGLSNIRFFVAGTRLEGTQDYYWTYPDGTFTGDLIDDPYAWSGQQWAGGGPSFTDQGRAETAVVLFHYPEESRYAFNDVGKDYLQYDYYYCGYAGYIIEYEN